MAVLLVCVCELVVREETLRCSETVREVEPNAADGGTTKICLYQQIDKKKVTCLQEFN